MAFEDYDSFTVERLRLPIKGREYLIPEVGAADAITLKLASGGDPEAVAKLQQPGALVRILLGDVHEQMLADNVPVGAIDRALLAAMAEHNFGRIAAEEAWRTGQDPEDRAAIMEASRLILLAAA